MIACLRRERTKSIRIYILSHCLRPSKRNEEGKTTLVVVFVLSVFKTIEEKLREREVGEGGEKEREGGGTNMYRDIHRLADIQTKRHRK